MRENSTPTVTFFFDPISPYAWLASKKCDDLMAAGLAIDCQPVLFAGLLNAHGQKGPAEIPAKRDYIFRDVVRLAESQGHRFAGPPTHPFNPLRALRMCIALDEQGERLRFARALMSACWESGEDLSDVLALARIADGCGLDQRQLGAAAETPEVKAKLLESTTAAINAGVFGVPTFLYRQELFWGCDRVDALLWRINHPAKESAALQEFLRRGASAQRKVQ